MSRLFSWRRPGLANISDEIGHCLAQIDQAAVKKVLGALEHVGAIWSPEFGHHGVQDDDALARRY